MTLMNEVTDEHCKEFDGYVRKWQAILGLHAWRLERSARRPKGVMAEVGFCDEAMLATYRIGRSFGSTPVTSETLESTALHELLHVLLRRFRMDPTEANEHQVVNTLEKILMEGMPR